MINMTIKKYTEKYQKGKISIIRNFNKRGGKFFYVIYKNDEWLSEIVYIKALGIWGVNGSNNKIFNLKKEEKDFIFEVKKNIEKEFE